MSAPYCIYHDCRMAHEATRVVMDLPLPPSVTAKIASFLYGHKWYPPQIDLLSDDEDDVILTPGPLDSDDDMPVAEAWRRKRPPAAPVKPPARKRARRVVVYSDPESDSESDASDLEDMEIVPRPVLCRNGDKWECDCRMCKRGGLCDGFYEYDYELKLCGHKRKCQ